MKVDIHSIGSEISIAHGAHPHTLGRYHYVQAGTNLFNRYQQQDGENFLYFNPSDFWMVRIYCGKFDHLEIQ